MAAIASSLVISVALFVITGILFFSGFLVHITLKSDDEPERPLEKKLYEKYSGTNSRMFFFSLILSSVSGVVSGVMISAASSYNAIQTVFVSAAAAVGYPIGGWIFGLSLLIAAYIGIGAYSLARKYLTLGKIRNELVRTKDEMYLFFSQFF